jgi:drug/metabolite transporter (DMT)-like permease
VLVLLLTVVIWAANNVVAKLILREASPLLVALVRFTLAGFLFHLPVFLFLHRGEQRFSRSDWRRVLLLGVVGVTGSLVLNLMALRTTPATDVAVYNLTTPLFVLLLARVFFGERLTRSRIAGIVAAFAGAVLLAVGGAVGLGGGDLQGAIFVLTGSLIWSGYTLLGKELLARRSPLLLLSAVNLGALVAIWPVAGLFGAWAELPEVSSWSPQAWWAMAYLVLLMSTTSQLFYIMSIRDLHSSQVSALLYTGPLFTALISAVTIGELPTITTVVAGLLILAGVVLVNRRGGVRSAPRVRPSPASRP